MRGLRLSALLLAGTALLHAPLPVFAQTMMVPAPPGDADELAAQMRQLAADPQNLAALIRAGELALRLEDNSAAAGFFARAERIDPRNARIKAGLGSLLVGEERPGEALRRFAEAEALGADGRAFAADRGLAYDLIGEQDRAQREYRAALRAASSDETVRRYALSLGISGKRDEAFAVLEPLLRRSDRGAWRSRAFILAMSGDQTGATQIATSMLPPGMAQGLQPFFDRLPSLPAADRAFAVHFGEIRPTRERVADVRLIPPLAALGPDPYAPRAVAAVVSPPASPVNNRDERRKSRKRKDAPVQVAAAPTPPPLPPPPAYVASSALDDEPLAPAASTLPPQPGFGRAIVQPLPTTSVASNPPPRPPVSFSAASVARPPAAAPTPAKPTVSTPPTSVLPSIAGPPATVPAENDTRVPTTKAAPSSPVVVAQNSSGDDELPVVPGRPAVASAAIVPAPPVTTQPVTTRPVPPSTPAVAPEPPSPVPAPVATVQSVPTTPEPVVARPAPKPAPVRSEDSILAAIISGIKVPDSERTPAPVPVPAAKPARPVATPPEKPGAVVAPAVKPGTKAAEAAKKAAAAAKKAADEKKRNDPKLLEPARIWVQVAGGANDAALVLAWNTMKGRAPAAFKGKQGWTTPLRATHRVLAGPFKTDDEARAFVNLLAKSGVQAFAFTSEAGQKITKLPTK
ncbi:SPOR domain-containing protein [Sphingomonas sp. AR_OL41]|uniref:tetratricopeptide repeat protein n=1 Tax=Sphingomonas sp. AR_OL41 TaxID=3042729 RepID=UPI00248009D3|nr:SPOR domain-containing protein [Sphingomonas sp. AR_OL41]MDH7971386.1 SPOR domain-containing protein [Sphingomonas sp. AR_OL41]